MKNFVFAVVVLAMLIPIVALGQPQPPALDQRTYYSKSAVGIDPPLYGVGGGVPIPGIPYGVVDNNGLVNPAGHACWQAADANCNALIVPGAAAIFNIRVMDGNGATLSDVHPTNGSVIPNTDDALEVANLNYGWDALNTQWINVAAITGMPAAYAITNNALNVVAGVYAYDVAGATGMVRIAETPMAATFIAANHPSLNTASGMYAFDVAGGANEVRLSETSNAATFIAANYPSLTTAASNYGFDVAGGANEVRIAETPNAATFIAANYPSLNVASSLYGFDVLGGANEVRISETLNAATYVAATFPALVTAAGVYGFDSTGGANMNRVTALPTSDGQALGINALNVNARLFGYNGATVDVLRTGAVKELQVTDVATRPGEDAANDWRKTKKQEIAVWTPAKEASGDIVAAATIVLASKEVVSWPNCCIYYRNKDAGVSLTDAALYTSPDNGGTCGDANWAQISWNDCETLAHGATCVYCFSEMAYRYVCGTASAAANPNDVDSVEAWITCNKS